MGLGVFFGHGDPRNMAARVLLPGSAPLDINFAEMLAMLAAIVRTYPTACWAVLRHAG
jgi:hypothetical protein